MNLSHRSYLTAGVAALSAGAIALAPVQPLPSGPDLSPTLRSTLAVDLAAAIDPITPWIDTFQAAADNISGLVNTWGEQPLPVVQQIVANLGTYISELPAIGTIVEQAVANVGNAARAPFAADLNTLDPAHTLAYQALPTLAPDIPQGLSDFLTTSTSGLIIGLLGPVLSPVLALGAGIRTAVEALQTSDWAAAVNALINIPAAMVNAFLNGGPTIDLTSLLAPSVLPNRLDRATVTLGGLLSQGASIFNAVGLAVSVKVGPVFVPSPPHPSRAPGRCLRLPDRHDQCHRRCDRGDATGAGGVTSAERFRRGGTGNHVRRGHRGGCPANFPPGQPRRNREWRRHGRHR